MRALIVDDSKTNRCVLAHMLSKYDECEVQEAATGQEALQAWLMWRPDIIWLDLHLPDISGVAIMHHIRASKGRQPYLVSVTSDQRDAALMKRLGADVDLTKPVTPALVNAVLRESGLMAGSAS